LVVSRQMNDNKDQIESFRASCASVHNWDGYSDLKKSLAALSNEQLWTRLWTVLLNYQDEASDTIAGYLLISIEPFPEKPCELLLEEISLSHWYLSNREVPFFLIVRFGKETVLSSIANILASQTISNHQRTLLEGVKYWASMPTAYLAERFHYFEWQEAIERVGD